MGMLEELDAYFVFRRVVEEGSLVKAARAMRRSKASVTNRLRNLEERLGVRLIERTTRSLKLTGAGQRYYERYGEVWEALRAARKKVLGEEPAEEPASGGSRPSGVLRLVLPSSLRRSLPYLLEFLSQNPGVSLEVVSREDGAPWPDGAELSLRVGALDEGPGVRKLARLPRVLIAAPSYLARAGAPSSPGDLVGHNCLRRPTEGDWRLSGKEGTLGVGVSGSFASDDEELLLWAVLSGVGVALLPRLLVAGYVKDGVLRRVLPGVYGEEAGLFALSRPEAPLSFGALALLEFLREKLAGQEM